MDLRQLKDEIEYLGIDPDNINLNMDEYGCFDACFNLIHKRNGNWEIFYGEKGKKINPKVFRTEGEACDAFVTLIRENLNQENLEDKPKYWKGYRRHATRFQINFITGIFVFSMLLGAFFAGYQIFTGQIDGFMWFWIGWIIVFGICAYCSRKEKTYEKFEYWGQPIIYGAIILILLVGMIATPIVNIPQIRTSENPVYDTIILILIEPIFPICIWGILKFVLGEYVDDLKKYIRSKKKLRDGEPDEEKEPRKKRSAIE